MVVCKSIQIVVVQCSVCKNKESMKNKWIFVNMLTQRSTKRIIKINQETTNYQHDFYAY